MIFNAYSKSPPAILDTGGICALCQSELPHGPNDSRMVRVAWSAYSGYAGQPKRDGCYLLVTFCQQCAEGLAVALAPLIEVGKAGGVS